MTWYDFTWTIVGILANAVFTCRFLVQWYVTEKRKQVTIPVMFWWFSLVGSLMLLLYAVFYDRHMVIIWAYAFPWIPYTRNLIIHYRHQKAEQICPACGERSSPRANFCPDCGVKLTVSQA
jgi:lipid-A-disaccharide synthase-like uncharacterized protein